VVGSSWIGIAVGMRPGYVDKCCGPERRKVTPVNTKVPTLDDYQQYDGAHCSHLWRQLEESWRCPGCDRTKFQIMRWTNRAPQGQRFKGWIAPLARHHDKSQGPVDVAQGRFREQVICDHCNTADGTVKRKLKLPRQFSFSPADIRQFIQARPHRGHEIDYELARSIFERIEGRVSRTLTDSSPTEPTEAEAGAER
jgi:rubredoxin